MMEEKHWHVSIPELFQLWVQGLHVDEIAKRLRTTTAMVYQLKTMYRLPKRERVCHREENDPPPDEIERRKAEIKARHMAEMRAKSDVTIDSRLAKRKKRQVAK